MKLVAGFGCQKGCPAEVLGSLLQATLLRFNLQGAELLGLASLDIKQHEPGLQALAEQLQRPLSFFSAAQLLPLEPLLSHRSAVAFAHTGCHGVAESAALALAQRLGGQPASLLVTRQKNAQATLALVQIPHDPR
ncbi:MAG: cobalamin biosynthesis protein [Pseudomonas sp.]|uniref:cobalamin biosynthesis protein n=1 Tax=Pseudomonas abieticivorans TaxID=2931382 RepID=UPI0020BEE4C1|nr:cobalamin biosynthesis protein [Pseudomonas sp. PIA16]MDE1166569.1 cobalamin biosynthesis protein [Pseudomonas sp.]